MVRGLRNVLLQLVGASMIGVVFPAAAETSARLERDTIDLGETVRLVIKSDVTDQNAAPDLSALAGTFDVLGTSVSQNISVVNGTQEMSRQWTVELEPVSAGSFTIPAINVINGPAMK